IDHRVHVVETDTTSTDLFAAPVGAPPTPVRDAAEFLDIDVHQFAGTAALIALCRGLGRLDHRTGHRIAVPQVGHAVATQDSGHSPCGNPQLRAQPVLTPTILPARGNHLAFPPRRGSGRAAVRPRGTVVQSRFAFGGVPTDPGVYAFARDPHRLSDMGLLPALLVALHDQHAPVHRGAGVTVGHENLRVGDGPSTSHTSPGGSPHIKPTRPLPTSWPNTPSSRRSRARQRSSSRLVPGSTSSTPSSP